LDHGRRRLRAKGVAQEGVRSTYRWGRAPPSPTEGLKEKQPKPWEIPLGGHAFWLRKRAETRTYRLEAKEGEEFF